MSNIPFRMSKIPYGHVNIPYGHIEIPSENGGKPLDLEKKQYNNNKLINK